MERPWYVCCNEPRERQDLIGAIAVVTSLYSSDEEVATVTMMRRYFRTYGDRLSERRILALIAGKLDITEEALRKRLERYRGRIISWLKPIYEPWEEIREQLTPFHKTTLRCL